MKFSILIAHYNNFKYFQDCYKSIINQTVQDFEVIIVDDCSSDDSLEKIKILLKNDFRFKIYKNEENKGVGYTKKKCIELATGNICGFLDPDDALINDALEISLKAYANDNIIATYSKFYLCDEYLNIQKIFKKSKRIKNKETLFFNINLEISHFFTFRKKAYLDTIGIDHNLSSSVDQDLYLKLYEIGEIYFLNKPLYLYRLHKKGVSQNKNKKKALNKNWHTVLENTLKRRNITQIYGTKVSEIDNLPKFVFEKENTFFKKLLRKFL